jgi:hypothetical protein
MIGKRSRTKPGGLLADRNQIAASVIFFDRLVLCLIMYFIIIFGSGNTNRNVYVFQGVPRPTL